MAVSKIFIFFAAFYGILFISAFAINASFGGVNPNCIKENLLGTPLQPEKPSALNFFEVAWNGVKAFFTMGMSLNCGVPAAINVLIGILNTICMTIIVIGFVFLVRGSD